MGDNILEQAASIVAQSETDNGALPLSTVHQYLMQKLGSDWARALITEYDLQGVTLLKKPAHVVCNKLQSLQARTPFPWAHLLLDRSRLASIRAHSVERGLPSRRKPWFSTWQSGFYAIVFTNACKSRQLIPS